MPTVEVSLKDMENLLGRKLSSGQLEELVLYAKGEVESVEGDTAKIDIKDTNRPDLWSAEGIAREISLRFRKPRHYHLRKSGLRIFVKKGMESIRPRTAAVVAKNVKITDMFLRQIIQLQEKIDGTFGRQRREIATGIYDFDKISGDIIFYPAEKSKSFAPLGFARPMTLDRILQVHPKGKEYGHLLKGCTRCPLFEDSAGNVLSMPPIINSDYTGKVTEDSTNLFIEVSGFRPDWLVTALNVIAMAFADRGADIFSVEIIYPGKKVTTPDFSPRKTTLNLDYARKITGLPLQDSEIYSLLEKSGYRVVKRGRTAVLEYPPYRQDIMHQADVVEDIAISYGYNSFPPESYRLATVGGQSYLSLFACKATETLIGMGLQEVLTYILTSRDSLFRKMLLPARPVAEISNPVSANWSVLRDWLLPGLLEFLSRNRHAEYPQRIFEIGDCVLPDSRKETRTRDSRRVAVALTDVSVSYQDITSVLDAFLRSFGAVYSLRKSSHPTFIPGRAADIIIRGRPAGVVGEVHPHVLNNWNLEKPVAAFDLDAGCLV
jgi:phenylalanyl-tRNA synthetase beta chain